MVVSLQPNLLEFRTKVDLHLDLGDFEARTAKNAEEVQMALRIRHKVFCEELGAASYSDQYDIDRYDVVADHLLLIEKKSGDIIGTYRFLCSEFTNEFYSQTEFHLDEILAQPGIKLELGRACVVPSHRGSMAIQLLWKGMTSYFAACGARYMFGCSSVDSHMKDYFPAVHQYLYSQHLTPEGMRVYPTQPLPEWIDLRAPRDPALMRKAERLVPPLLKAYLRAGSFVAGMPFWDPDFQTLDYFTLFDAQLIDESYSRKFGI